MSIVYQLDKRSGLTYAYESKSTWDKEKKQSRSKRTLIGRVDKETGNIVATDGRMKREKVPRPPAVLKEKNKTKRLFYGATYLLDEIGKQLGLTNDLQKCFPDTYKQIQSLAYYLILEDKNPLYRFEKWGYTHRHPYGYDISSQQSSDLFMGINEDAIQEFFRLQGKRRIENEYWAYDITSVSSYSETLKQVRYGFNKEDDKLPQMNLALVFGEDSRLPFYYRKLAGNIPDVKTVRSLLADFEALGFNKVKLVMDRGFYSADNINGLLKEHLKFLISIRTSLLFVRNELDKVYEDLPSFENYDETHQLYSMTVPSEWDYVQERPYKGTPLKEKRHVYLHLYYNIDRAAEDQKNFDLKLMMLNKELVSGNRKSEHEKLYDKYFVITETPPCGSKIQVNRDEVKKAKKYYGYFALMSNEKMDSISALSLYRNKDLVEKAFGNLKERLCLRRSLVSSEQSLSGKLFVEFVALIYLSFINRRMQDTGLYKEYTMSSLLDKIDVIECFLRPNRKLTVGEVIEKQISIFNHFNILPPVSL